MIQPFQMWLIFLAVPQISKFWIIRCAFSLGTVSLSNNSLGKETKEQKNIYVCTEDRLFYLAENKLPCVKEKKII